MVGDAHVDASIRDRALASVEAGITAVGSPVSTIVVATGEHP
jgi:hypothetical protein